MGLRIETVTNDAVDPEALAEFWCAALEWVRRTDEDGDIWIEPGPNHPDADRARPLLLMRVPGHKSVKNRIHLDLVPDDQEREVERLEALGATRPSIGQTGNESWVVLADPEGNEFCVLDEPVGPDT